MEGIQELAVSTKATGKFSRQLHKRGGYFVRAEVAKRGSVIFKVVGQLHENSGTGDRETCDPRYWRARYCSYLNI